MDSNEKADIYIKLKKEIKAYPKQNLLLKDLVILVAPLNIKQELNEVTIKRVKQKPESSMVISLLEIIEVIKKELPQANINCLGDDNVVVDIIAKRENVGNSLLSNNNPSLLFICLVGIILFIGSGMAIMHFHADVNIKKVHQAIYFMVMGQNTKNPLLLEIPYSLGIACGMIIFFNNFFNFKFDSDPSPLEVEMLSYENRINQYAIQQNNKEVKNRDMDSS